MEEYPQKVSRPPSLRNTKHCKNMTDEQKTLVEDIKRVCLANYEQGGDEVIECYTDEEIIRDFKSVADAKDYCGLRVENATNHRWGEDSDPELARAAEHKNWKDE